MRAILLILPVLGLGAVEAVSYWWMHPSTALDLKSPLLTYRPPPSSPAGTEPTSSAPVITTMPETYQKAAPILRCTSGDVFHMALDHDKRVGINAAWFAWDHTDAGSVLEAFRHPPADCMGSIGMKLVSHEPPIPYTIGGQTLLFEHSIFQEPGASNNPLLPSPPVHSFRAVWVGGLSSADATGKFDRHSLKNLRSIRFRAALTRQRPPHARVIQGAVRGTISTQEAWQTFENAILRHITLSTPIQNQ